MQGILSQHRATAGFRVIAMALAARAAFAGPPNDNCGNAPIVTNGDTAYSTVGASTDGAAEFPICNQFAFANIDRDIWYHYSSSCTGLLNVELCDSDFDTKVAVYTGCTCPAPSPPIGCNDDFCVAQSFLSVPAQQGSCYTIRIGGYIGQSGSGTMSLSCTLNPITGACCNSTGSCLGTMFEADCDATNGTWYQGENCGAFVCPIPGPGNDECEDCISLSTGVAFNGTSLGATGNLTTCGPNDTKDVWHCWTADCTGLARVSTCGSAFDTTLAVYDACNGQQLGCNDDGCLNSGQLTRSQVSFSAVAGNTYFIRVAGRNAATGSYRVQVDPCRNACCINGGSDCANVTPQQCAVGGGTPGVSSAICQGDADANGINDACEAAAVPAISEWGLLVLTLLGLTLGTILFKKPACHS